MSPLGIQIIAEFSNCSKLILDGKKTLEDILTLGIKKYDLNLISMQGHKFQPIGITIVAIIGKSHITIHTYPEARHASIDIFTCSDPQTPMALLRFLKEKLEAKSIKVMEISRGHLLEIKNQNWITSSSPDGFEIKYFIKNRLLSAKSQYQQIDIIENDCFGNMMFLDGDLQVAEKDADIYNTNMVLPIVKAKKESGDGLGKIAILGGGDGGVLQELLKHKPEKVFLIDIDKKVIDISKQFLQGICKKAFENPRTKIIIQDANEFLRDNHNFDAIIYDLTGRPETLTTKDHETFLDEIFSKASNNLNKKGVISLQCCSEYDKTLYKLIKKILPRYFSDIAFSKTFIPSFCEHWIFACARKK